MKYAPHHGATTEAAQSLLRYRSIVVANDAAAMSVVSAAHQHGLRISRHRVYRGHGVRLRLVTGPKKGARATIYGSHKAAVVELERTGEIVVPCANAAECVRVAARRIGFRVSVARVSDGSFRRVTLVKDGKAAA